MGYGYLLYLQWTFYLHRLASTTSFAIHVLVDYLHKDVDRSCKNKFLVLQDRAIVILKAFDEEPTALELEQRFDLAKTYIYSEELDENVNSDFEDLEKV